MLGCLDCEYFIHFPIEHILTKPCTHSPYNHLNFSANLDAQDKITNVFGAALEELTPGGGAYLNEGDPHQPDWQTTFYGENYERLLAIKNKYDPEGLLYALTAVGSEQWAQKQDGRLCRA